MQIERSDGNSIKAASNNKDGNSIKAASNNKKNLAWRQKKGLG